ncbi:hypothetical protein KGP36_02800 [Patescibacteria group bacterium]|nr:hypothetical protein [Patescibacteria group bacterium]
MERAQIDTQVATAHQYPRSLEQFKKRALSMATLDEESAESCIYCRPVGREQNEKGEWVEKYAEGASIRLAEIVAASYGNIRVAARIVEQTERFVRCEGVAHDLESNYAGKSECMESTVTKQGKPYSERQRSLVAKVCLAKAYRDACFKVVPRALCKPVFEAAKKVAAGQGKPLEERRKKAKAWVSGIKMDNAEGRVFAALGVKGWNDVTDDHLLRLTGLKTAIQDGDETYESAFPAPEQQGQGQQPQDKNKPAPTAHQQATQGATTTPEPPKTDGKAREEANLAEHNAPKFKTGEDNVSFEGATPLKTAQDAPKQESTPSTPPGGQTTQAPQNAPQGDGKESATTSTQTAEALKPSEDPKWAFVEGDSDAVKSIKTICKAAGVSFENLAKYLKEKHLMRDNQSDLRELAAGKLEGICRNVGKWMPEIAKKEK